jgi:NCAIR mutase (PurE)-related protein
MVDLNNVLHAVADGELTVAEARHQLEGFTRVDDFARLDTIREGRKSIPEVVLGEGKNPDQVVEIARDFLAEVDHVMISRVDDEMRRELQTLEADTEWHDDSRMMVLRTDDYQQPEQHGRVAVLSGGTSDVPVAEEAAVIAREMGCEILTMYDVGVAGIHRLLSEVEDLDKYDCLIVAAGREGALPTVVAGLVDAPVIGLPVSIGYGYGGDGESALMSMLQSCSVLSVVNIDAGFVAGAQAAQIARQ